MTASREPPNSLRNQFLVASPYLQDPRFHGAVIYICEHSNEGALGLMVNQVLDIHLGEILEQLDMDGGELDVPVYSGGPVQQERGFVLHTPELSWQNTAEVTENVWLTTSRDVLSDIGSGIGPEQYLVCLGYAGWSEGQLEEELASNAWLNCPASPELLFNTAAPERYSAVLKAIGVDINQLSESVGHA
jgi:putative transcriptional regulator